MGRDYIPTKDVESLYWMRNFAFQISTRYSAYGQSPADAESIDRAVREYAEAYTRAVTPGTRTVASVRQKDEARNLAMQLLRCYAMQIKRNLGVTDANKLALRILPINPTRVRVPAPTTSPWLNIVGATYGCHTLRFKDGQHATGRAKPFGVIGLQIFLQVGGTRATVKHEDAKYLMTATKSPVGIEHKDTDGGKLATYFGRWVTRSGLEGPWSLPVSLHVAA